MTIKLNPPPLQVPAVFLQDRQAAGFFSGLLNTIYQLWTSVYAIRSSAKTTTSDNTVTALIRVRLPTNKTAMVQAHIVARRTGGTSGAEGDSAFYVLTGAYRNVNGVMTGIASPDLYGGEDQIGWNVGFSTSGEEIVVTVLGATGNNVSWEGTISVYEVGS